MRTKDLLQKSFILIYMLRRIIYVGSAFSTTNSTFQLLGLLYVNLVVLIYQASVKPLELRTRNKLELFNENCIILSCFFFVCFTDFVLDKESQYMVGWGFCMVIFLNLAVNCIFILTHFFHNIKMIHSKYSSLFKQKTCYKEKT